MEVDLSRIHTAPLGTLPIGWNLVKLKDITIKIGSGATPRGGDRVYSLNRKNFAFIRSQNVFNRYFNSEGLVFISDEHATELQKVSVLPGDLLLNITGDGVTFSRACIVPEEILPACVNQHVSIIRPNPKICDSGYLLSYLTHPLIKTYIESFNSGGSRRSITKGHIESFLISIPPLSEQKAIAHILSSLDDKIELNRQMNETLEAMARAIFKSWFVDFDPVRAKMEGRQPAGMDAATADLFPDEFEESSLGLIPKGWKVGTIETECKLIMGQSPKSEFYNTTGDGLPFHQGVTNFGVRFPTHKTFCSVSERIANKGDILFSVRAPVGRINIADKKLIIGRGLAAIRHNQDYQSFLLYHLVHTFKEEDSIGTGTIFASVTRKELQEVKLIAPKDLIVKVFDAKIQIIDKMIAENEQQSYTLATLRDTLLPRLMSGEIRVKEAEKIMEKST